MIKNNKGFIFDIQRGSFVDGPGLRTVVFCKGCNLNCQWCHNPEGIKSCRQLLFYEDKCTGCGKCAKVCDNNFTSCHLCGKCAEVCENDARVLCGKDYFVDDLMQIVLKDKIFYQTSGGGVTISGGECLLQIDFIKEFLLKLKSEGIHTAIDTAGNVDFSCFEKIIDYTDLFLYDVKLFSKNLHKKYTGVNNDLILENLEKLVKIGKSITIRIPIIPTINDNEDEMLKINSFLTKINFSGEIELLPYHTMGENKNKALKNKFIKFETLDKNKLKDLQNIFE